MFPLLIGGALSGLGSYLGGKSQADASAEAARQQRLGMQYGADVSKQINTENLDYQRMRDAALRSSYQNALRGPGGAVESLGKTEDELNRLSTTSPEEFMRMKNDIATGQSEQLQRGTGELASRLAMSGVRGGQAATQMRRGIGEMTTGALRDYNQLTAQEAMQRKASMQAYQAAKGQQQSSMIYNPMAGQLGYY